MIGSVIFDQHGNKEVVVLNDDGEWDGSDKEIVDALNAACNPNENGSPALGVFGYHSLQQAAKMLKGIVKGVKPLKKSKDDEVIIF